MEVLIRTTQFGIFMVCIGSFRSIYCDDQGSGNFSRKI